MNERKKGILLSYATIFANFIIGVFYTPFMLKKVGASQYGIYTMAGSLTSLLTMLDLGLNSTMIRYIAKYRAIGDKESEERLNGLFLRFYCALAVISAVVGVVLLFAYESTLDKMTAQELTTFRYVFFIFLINIVVSFPLCIFSAILTSYERFTYLKLLNLICIFLKYGSILIVLVFGYKVIAISAINVAMSILLQLAYALYCLKVIKIRFKFGDFDKKILREIIVFSFFIFLNVIIDYINFNSDKLILGTVCGSVTVAVYTVGKQFSGYFQELSLAISGVFLPKVSHIYENEKDMKKLSELFNGVGRIQMLIIFFVFSIFAVLGGDFIELWVGPDYKDAFIIALISITPAIIPWSQNLGISILNVMNLHRYRSCVYLIIAILNIGISIPLSMYFEGIGAAIGTLIATILGQILFMNWFYYKKVGLDIKSYWRSFGRIGLYSVITVLVLRLVGSFIDISSWTSFFGLAVVYSVIYVIGLYMLVMNDYDKQLIIGFVKKRKKL